MIPILMLFSLWQAPVIDWGTPGTSVIQWTVAHKEARISPDGTLTLPPGITQRQALAALYCWLVEKPESFHKIQPQPKCEADYFCVEYETIETKCDKIGADGK